MKSISATLTTAQQTARDPALARASLADNGHLHLALFADKGSAGVTSVACLHGSSIVRIRRSSPTGFDYQVITDPTVAANWTAGWTSFGYSNISGAVALFTAGTHVVAVWVDSSDNDLKYSRSTTGAGSWSSPAVAYALTGSTNPAGVSHSAGTRCGLFFWNANDIHWGAYNPATDTWATKSSAGLTATIFSHVAAAWDAANTRYIIAFTYHGILNGAFSPIATMTRSGGFGFWSTPRLWLLGATGNTTDQGGLSLSQAKHNGFWWLTFWRYKDWTSTNRVYLTRSADGEYFEEPIALTSAIYSTETEPKTEVIGSLAGSIWAADERYIYRATPQTFWANQRLRTYELNLRSPVNPLPARAAAGSSGQGGVQGSTLVAEVDASAGLADPELFSVLTLERGYSVAGVDYYQSAGAFYVTAYEYILQDNLLRLYGIDAAGLLFQWQADQAHRYAGESIQALLTRVCAMAGVHSVSFDGNAIFADTIAVFSLNPGATGYHALQSLAQRAAFNLRATETGGLYFYVPTTSPAADHTYGPGSGQHLHWPGRFGKRVSANFVLVLGDTVAHSAESHDLEAQALTGRRVSASIYDQRVGSSADASQLAAPQLIHAQEAGAFHDLEAPPNFALELGDVIDVQDGGFGQANGPWRVTGVDEFYNPASLKQKFFQRAYLRGTT